MKIKMLIFLFFSFLACDFSNTGLYKIDPISFTTKQTTLSQIADDIEYIPLDNASYLSNIMEIVIEDTFIAISSQSKSEGGIYFYNREGTLTNKIENIVGKGPGECTYCTDFTINKSRDRIYIVDGMREELEVYSLKGSYMGTIHLEDKIKGFPTDIAFWNSNLLIGYSGSEEFNWAIVDTTGNVIDKKRNALFPYDCNVGLMGGFYKFKDEINYWDPFNDTIFNISHDWKYRAAYFFKREQNWLPPLLKDISEFALLCKIYRIFETNKYIYLSYGYQKRGRIALINKKDKKIILSSEIGILNTLDGGPDFPMCRTYYTENGKEYLVGFINAFEFKSHVSSNEFKNSTPIYPEKKKELEKLANSLSDNDNPVLMLVKLKE